MTRKFAPPPFDSKKWAVKLVNRRKAIVFGIVNGGSTLLRTITAHMTTAQFGVIRLPPNADSLIEKGNVQIDGHVCQDREQVLQAGGFVAVFPDETMYIHESPNGARSLRLKA